MKEFIYYTLEVIKAIWPIAIIMGIIAIPILSWILNPREKKTKDLLDHPTSSMNEPYPDKNYCEYIQDLRSNKNETVK